MSGFHRPRRFYALVLSIVVSIAAIAGLVEVAGTAAASPHPLDWCPEAQLSYSPTWGYTGDTLQFSYDYSNTNGNAVTISHWYVTYSWISSQRDLGTANVPGEGSHTFYDSEILPGSAQSATISISGDGQAAGDWFSSTCTWNPVSLSVIQLPAAPTVIATASVTSGTAPLTVSFTATVSQGLGPFTYSWTMGDGTSAAGSTVSHTYSTAGSYDAQIVVTDSRDRSSSNTVIISVASPSSSNPGGGGNTGGNNNGGGGLSTNSAPVDYTPYYLGILVVVIVVIVAGALLLSVRKRGGGPRPQPGTWNPPAQPPANSSPPPRSP